LKATPKNYADSASQETNEHTPEASGVEERRNYRILHPSIGILLAISLSTWLKSKGFYFALTFSIFTLRVAGIL
jgi:hypothetical protein